MADVEGDVAPATALVASVPATPGDHGEVPDKVFVQLEPVNAPILKQRKFKVSKDYEFAYIAQFLRKTIQMQPQDPLFLFVNSTFAPCMNETIGDLWACFQVQGTLVVNYSPQPAWG
eukprot:GGOE01040993.1.p2 GENE.GGOE01040993.1~~GGOE01040993.1.p2  ORF type:complete len:137 (+),score=35.12 GGOE01040993.1:63-413(+)